MQADRRPSGRQSTVLPLASVRLPVKSGLSVAARKRWQCRRPRIRVSPDRKPRKANGMLALGKNSSALHGATPRLQGAAGALDDLPHRAMMARAIAFLFAAGATMTLAVLAGLPHTEANLAGVLATTGVAYGAALVVLLRHARIAPGAYPWIAALGTVLITLGIHFRGTPTAADALFYLWVILYSGY